VYLLIGEVTLDGERILFVLLKFIALTLMTAQLCVVMHRYSVVGQFVIVILTLLSLYVGFINEKWVEMYATCALVFGAKGEKYETILRYYFSISLLFCLLIIFLNKVGIVREVVATPMDRESYITGDNIDIRHSFGYVWPTDFATHVFFILLTFWFVKRGKLNKLTMLVYLIVAFAILKYADARLGVVCILMLVISSFLISLRKKKEEKLSKWYLPLVVWIPFAAFLIFYLVLRYDDSNGNMIILNFLLSGRLRIGQEALVENGLTMFGQKYVQYGGNSPLYLYNFIDSAFLQLFIIFGICYTLLFLFAFTYIAYRAYKRGDKVLLIAIFIAGFSGMIAQHFIQIYMNPLLIALTASHKENKNK